MFNGAWQANRCAFAFPNIGVVVLEYIAGEPIGDLLSNSSTELRQKTLNNCGLWLRKFSGDHLSYSNFAPKFWLKLLDCRKPEIIASKNDQGLLNRLREFMATHVNVISGQKTIKGPTHDDFVPSNLLINNDILYGIGLQGETVLPLAKATAQFLVLLKYKRSNSNSDLMHGISRQDCQSFLGSGILPVSEINTILPFFIAEQFYFHLQNAVEKHVLDKETRQEITVFLDS